MVGQRGILLPQPFINPLERLGVGLSALVDPDQEFEMLDQVQVERAFCVVLVCHRFALPFARLDAQALRSLA